MTAPDDSLTITCTTCGASSCLHYSGELGERMKRDTICFSCAFWQRLIAHDAEEPEIVAIISGRHYIIRPDIPRDRPLALAGFGGARQTIKFKDGREVVTKNLWHQGEIPERWREQLPDNAEWGSSA